MAIDGSRSNFTSDNNYTLDTFKEMFELSPSDVANVRRWKTLKATGNTDNDEFAELTINLSKYLVTSEDWNLLLDAMYNLQKAYKDKGLNRVEALEEVIDNLESDSDINPLSAKQGKILNKKIEGNVDNNDEGLANKFLIIADKVKLTTVDDILMANTYANMAYITLNKGTYLINGEICLYWSEMLEENKSLIALEQDISHIVVSMSDTNNSFNYKTNDYDHTVNYYSNNSVINETKSYSTIIRVKDDNTTVYFNAVGKADGVSAGTLKYMVSCNTLYAFKLSDTTKMVKTQNGTKYYYDY